MSTTTLTSSSPPILYLCKKDKRLAKLISTIGDITYSTHSDDPYSFIIHEIIEQMLSIKAGAKIYSRFEDLCEGTISPDIVGALSLDQIRSTGTSSNKAIYIKELTSIKGIGNWTAKMYLIFVLDRQNILPIEDAAFLQSFCWLYKMNNPTKNEIIKNVQNGVHIHPLLQDTYTEHWIQDLQNKNFIYTNRRNKYGYR